MHSLNETCPCCDPVRWRADGINTHESGLSQNHNAAGMFPILLGSPRSLPGHVVCSSALLGLVCTSRPPEFVWREHGAVICRATVRYVSASAVQILGFRP